MGKIDRFDNFSLLESEEKDYKDYKVIDGFSFKKDTPDEVCKIICAAYKNKTRLRFHWGDKKTGEDWGDTYGVRGTVGRSTGSIKVPLLIQTSRSMGGGSILDDATVKIVDIKNKKTVYEHPKYHTKNNESNLNEAGLTRMSLDEDDFKQLVSGKVVSNEGTVHSGADIEIALKDIGYARMLEIIKKAMQQK